MAMLFLILRYKKAYKEKKTTVAIKCDKLERTGVSRACRIRCRRRIMIFISNDKSNCIYFIACKALANAHVLRLKRVFLYFSFIFKQQLVVFVASITWMEPHHIYSMCVGMMKGNCFTVKGKQLNRTIYE